MATEHEYRLAYEGSQARHAAHVDRLDGEIKELQQRIAELEAVEAAAKALVREVDDMSALDGLIGSELYVEQINHLNQIGKRINDLRDVLAGSNPALGTEKRE